MNRRIPGSILAVLLLLLFAPFATSSATGSGNCLDFDGTDDYADGTGISTSLTNLTLEAWVYHHTLPNSIERYVTIQGVVAVLRHDGVSHQGQLHFYIKTDGVRRDIRVNGALQLDRWYHVAGTWDGTNMKLYLDGKEVGTLAPGGSLDAPNGDVRLSSSGEPMDGYVDEVRIWSVARSPDEIRSNMYTTLSGSESGLESYWKLDESSGSTAYDSAGSVDLTLYNMTNSDWVTSGAFSGPRNVLDFDGTDDYVNVPDDNSLDFEAGEDFTIELWVKDNGSSPACNLVSKGDGAQSSEWGIRDNWDGSTIIFRNNSNQSLSASGVLDGSWHHVAVVGDRDGDFRLYVDGVLKDTEPFSSYGTFSNSYPLNIGRRSHHNDEYFTGRIDEVRIWNDVRTPTEIRGHMCEALVGDESGLVAYYRFDQVGGATLYDWSSNANAGTLTNMMDGDWVACAAFNTWIGCFTNMWSSYRNWSLDVIPNSTAANVGIPYAGWEWPVITDNYACNHLCIGDGATLQILSGWTLTLNGNAFSSGSTTDDGEVDLTGASAAHAIAGTFENVELNEAGGAELEGDATINGILTLTSGALTLGANTLTLKNAIAGTATNLNAGNTSSITIAGNGTGINVPGSVTELNNVTLNNINGTTLQNTLGLDGTLTLTNGTFTVGANTLTLKNAIAGTATNLSAGNTSSITIAGSGTGVNIPGSVTELNNVTLDNTNGTALQNTLGLDGTLMLTDGALSIGTNTLTLNGLISVGSGSLTGGSSSDIVFGGSGASTDLPAVSLNDLTINRANGIGLAGDVTVDGTLTMTDGAITLNGSTLSYGPSGTLRYHGSAAQTTTAAEFPSADGPQNVTVENTSGVNLSFARTIDGTLALISGDLDLSGYTLTLGASATLSESDGNTVKGDSGAITTTRTFNADDLSTGENIAGMGAEITTNAGLGQTTITRGHAVQTAKGVEGILRYFDITPTNNSGLDATLMFHYDDSELNGLTESDLELYRSANEGITWSNPGGTVDTDNETITVSGIDVLSRWSAFEGSGIFTNIGAGLPGVSCCSVAWGDYDNDGDLDALVAGYTSSGHITRIYRNDSGTFTNIGAGLPGVLYCSVAWGDYDNDGDLDALVAGYISSGRITRIYRNEGSGTFTNIGAGLPGVRDCGVAWGDYDNDGDLDVLVAGWTGISYITRIYRNDSGAFTNIDAGLPGVRWCSVAWGDYDNDGDLDVLLAGWTGSRITRIYRNEGSGTFTNIGAGLPGVRDCGVAWGDYDNDGDLDVLLAGWTGSSDITRIYRNEGSGTFTNIDAGLPGVYCCSVAWGDYDNDGDLDVLVAGYTAGSHITRIYRNDSGTFTNIGAGLPGVDYCSVAWGDYDNDGDLDAFLAGWTGSTRMTRIYRNDGLTTNTVPDAPSNPAASVSDQEVTLSWVKSTNTETAVDALTYNLRIGISPGGMDIMTPMADAGTGYRRVPALGNTNHDTTWVIHSLPGGVHYWSVQAIDNAFAGSAFATEGTFSVISITTASVTDITKTTATSGGEVTHEGGFSVTAKGVVWDTSENPTVGTHLGMTNDGSGLGSFVSSLTGLTSGETYYVRAYATNAEQTAHGENKVFATNMTPPGNGLDFDGSDDYVDLQEPESLGLQTFTLCCWFRKEGSGVTTNTGGGGITAVPLVTKGRGEADGDSRDMNYFLGISDGGVLAADFEDMSSGGNHPISGATAVQDSVWYHASVTYDGSALKLYLNGKQENSVGAGAIPRYDSIQDNAIGSALNSGGSPGGYFHGKIDEVRIWNVARSETDIQTDMNKVMNGDEAGLAAYYRFDHLSGTALSDRTTNDNDGTLMNMDDTDWVTSAAAVGHHSHVGLGIGNLVENVDVPVDITWEADPGTDAIFAAIQVDDFPDTTGGLPVHYDSTYWELWIAHDDGSFQADVAFHYDNLSGIWDETALALYTRTAPGQSWSLVSGTTTDYEGSTSDGVGSITANDLTAFSQFIIGGGNEMTLDGSVSGSDLVLEWTTCPSATAYWVYGADNEAYFEPGLSSPHMHRQAVVVSPTTTWTSPSGIGDADHNWVYLVIAVDGSEQEITRSNRAGEHDFVLP